MTVTKWRFSGIRRFVFERMAQLEPVQENQDTHHGQVGDENRSFDSPRVPPVLSEVTCS